MQRIVGMGSSWALNVVQAPRLRMPLTATVAIKPRTQLMTGRSGTVRKHSYDVVVRAYQSEAAEPSSKRYFSGWTVYKGSNAMAIKPIKPTWRDRGTGFEMTKPGVLLVEFAPVNKSGGSLGLNRDYSWDQKQSFALSFVELGSIVANNTLNLFHDPNMNTSAKGSVTKALKMSPMTDGTGGCMLALNVTTKATGTVNHVVPMTAAEMATFRAIANYLIPKLAGFEEPFLQPIETEPAVGQT